MFNCFNIEYIGLTTQCVVGRNIYLAKYKKKNDWPEKLLLLYPYSHMIDIFSVGIIYGMVLITRDKKNKQGCLIKNYIDCLKSTFASW